MGSLAKRILVALAAIPLLLGVTFLSPTLPFKILVVLALLLALQELFQLMPDQRTQPLNWVAHFSLLLILLPAFDQFIPYFKERESVVLGLLFLSLTFLFSSRPPHEMLTSVSLTYFGVLYFGILGGYFLLLRDLPRGSWLLLFVYVATWAYDTGGYFVGRFFGRHKMTPRVSPKKSWEGSLGGFVFTFTGLFLLWKFIPVYQEIFGFKDILILSLLMSLFGQLGDLVESMIKRSLSAKDSGSFFPGHGGIFDRIDSLLFNAPILFYYLTIRF
jgi:phosphatidate cytidylyltransferase